MGNVLQAGQGQNPARQAAAKGGVPMDVPAVTVNSVCLSGIHAIHQADLLIRSGHADVVVAGGMESMSQAPYLLPGARAGFRLGDVTAVDAMIRDGLWCAFDDVHMGAGTEAYTKAAGISRARQDQIAAAATSGRACPPRRAGWRRRSSRSRSANGGTSWSSRPTRASAPTPPSTAWAGSSPPSPPTGPSPPATRPRSRTGRRRWS